jgi:hypothetical protein
MQKEDISREDNNTIEATILKSGHVRVAAIRLFRFTTRRLN